MGLIRWVYVKTTVEIADALLAAAKERAARDGTTLRAMVEEGLVRVLDEGAAGRAFTLRDASVGGRGLRPELREAGWERIRDLAYEMPGV